MSALDWERSPLEYWLDEVQRRGVKMGLDRIHRALEAIDSPQDAFPSTLVGGTNGKGSTVAFLSSLLQAADLRVGSTFSPHLSTYRERFLVDGSEITQEALETLVRGLRSEMASVPKLQGLTFFELGVLIALSWFRERAVDVAAIEVGMGGEFDATRGAAAQVAAVVSVDLDHERFLGSSVEAIARTKARIAPPGGILVTGEEREDRWSILEEECEAVDCRLWRRGRDFQVDGAGGLFSYEGPGLGMRDLQLGPRGDHQWGNAGVALACVEALNAVCGLPLPKPEAIGLALAETRVPGRLEQLTLGGGRPSVLLDGAHNPAAARCLARHLSRATRPRRRWWLFAAMGDKDRRSMLEALVPQVDGVLCTAGRTSARFLDPCALKAEVEEVARSLGVSLAVEWAAEPGEAMAWLGEELGAEDEVLVAGSLYLVGDVREDLLGVS